MNSVPKPEFICPITLEVMEDPVVDNEGCSYERTAIEKWLLAGNSTSPKTKKKLVLSDLRPNVALRSMISDWKKSLQDAKSAPLREALGKLHTSNSKAHKSGEGGDTDTDLEMNAHVVNNSIYIDIKTNKFNPKEPIDFLFVADCSGSMSTTAVIRDADGSSVHTNLQIMDLVKHLMKLVIHVVPEGSRVGIVQFDSHAKTVFELTEINKDTKGRALKKIKEV